MRLCLTGSMASPVQEGRALPTYAQETRRLRELHESYAWQVNAAIGEGREDLVRQLCDDFLARSLEIMSAGQSSILHPSL